jgi:hypothetical protein
MRCVRSEHAWRALAAGVLSSVGVCFAPPVLAQSINIPLQLERANDGVILTINVGINGGPARPYLFDTGSDIFNAYYTSAAAFGGLPGNMASIGLPTSTKTTYGDSGPSNEYDSNVLAVPYLTFHATPTATSGLTLNAVTPNGTASNFLVNAVYAHDGLITTPRLRSRRAPSFRAITGSLAPMALPRFSRAGRPRHSLHPGVAPPEGSLARPSSVASSARPWSPARPPATSSPPTGCRLPRSIPMRGLCRVRP